MDAKEVDVAKVMIRDWVKSMCDAYKIDNEEIFNMLREDDDKDSVADIQGFCKHDAHRVKFRRLRQYKAGVTTFRVCQDIWVINYGEECYVADRELARECENAYRALKKK